MDKNAAIRSIPFLVVAHALGISLEKFKKKGHDWVGPCPIHGSKNNVGCFRYHEDGRYNCFSEGCKGRGSIDLTKAVKQIGFNEAVAFLEPLIGQQPPQHPQMQKSPLVGDCTASSGQSDDELKPFDGGNYRKFARPSAWLAARIPDQTVLDRYGVFYYENNTRQSAFNKRVMIPVKDVEGGLYGYLGRSTTHSKLDQQNQTTGNSEPKYLFPKNLPKGKFLFGAYELKQHLLSLGTGKSVYQHVYLVESPFCVLKFASLGLPCVAAYGWSVSEDQISILVTLAKGVVYLPDANKQADCGQVVHNMGKRLWVRCPPLPAGVDDPENLTVEQIRGL